MAVFHFREKNQGYSISFMMGKTQIFAFIIGVIFDIINE
jgi:hypothetical protein